MSRMREGVGGLVFYLRSELMRATNMPPTNASINTQMTSWTNAVTNIAQLAVKKVTNAGMAPTNATTANVPAAASASRALAANATGFDRAFDCSGLEDGR